MLDHLRGAFRSLTMWFNGIAAAFVAGLPMIREEFPALEQYLSHEIYRYAMIFIVGANALLRIKTNASLADKVKP